MRSLLRAIAAIVFLTALGWWWTAGAHRGWTKTSERIWKYDEITEISYPETVKRFVPGVDFLAAAIIASLVAAGSSFVFRSKPSNSSNSGAS